LADGTDNEKLATVRTYGTGAFDDMIKGIVRVDKSWDYHASTGLYP
jgi:hypothetical protein